MPLVPMPRNRFPTCIQSKRIKSASTCRKIVGRLSTSGRILFEPHVPIMIHIAPSILAADFSRLGEQVLETERAGAQRIHVDVMDGHFVPNLSIGPAVVASLRPRTKLPLEVHLMVREPARFVDAFLKAGADSLLVHHEVLADPRPLLQTIRDRGKKAGLAVNPETPVDVLEAYLPWLDVALCMTVHPGFGGQPFLPEKSAAHRPAPRLDRTAESPLRAGSGRRHRRADGARGGGSRSKCAGGGDRDLPLSRGSGSGRARTPRAGK